MNNIIKITTILALLVLLLSSNGCFDKRYVLKQDDVTVEKRVIPKPDKQVEIKVNWGLLPEIRANYPTELYYPPFLVIVPTDRKEWYHNKSSLNGYQMYTLASLPREVINNVLAEIPDYEWEKNSQLHFGWTVHTKSFEQGSVGILFKQANEQEPATMEPLKVYFIYYDPVAREGWVKLI